MVPQPSHDPQPRLSLPALWWGLGLVGVAIVLWLSLTPRPPALPGDTGGWLGHLLAYATMMAWFARLCRSGPRRAAAAVALCALGVAIEYAQRETGYRSFDVMDMLMDAAGVALGWLASPPRVPSGIAALDRALAPHFKRNPGDSP